MSPLTLPFGELDEVGNCLGCIFFKEAANDRSFAGFKRGIKSGLASHGNPFEISIPSVVVRLALREWRRHPAAVARATRPRPPASTLLRFWRYRCLWSRRGWLLHSGSSRRFGGATGAANDRNV